MIRSKVKYRSLSLSGYHIFLIVLIRFFPEEVVSPVKPCYRKPSLAAACDLNRLSVSDIIGFSGNAHSNLISLTNVCISLRVCLIEAEGNTVDKLSGNASLFLFKDHRCLRSFILHKGKVIHKFNDFGDVKSLNLPLILCGDREGKLVYAVVRPVIARRSISFREVVRADLKAPCLNIAPVL